MPRNITDSIEKIVADALDAKNIAYLHESEGGTQGKDFWVPSLFTFIECKQFFAARVINQLEKADNVILIQGRNAAHAFANLLNQSAVFTTVLLTLLDRIELETNDDQIKALCAQRFKAAEDAGFKVVFNGEGTGEIQ